VPTVAVDLPGHGDDTEPLADLHGDAAAVRAAIDELGGAPVVLCGHSYGGAVITEAGVHPDVRHLVYLCAFNLDTGETCAAAAPDIQAASIDLSGVLVFSDDGATTSIEPSRAIDVFYNACSPEDAAWALSRLGLHSMAGFGDSPSEIAWHTTPSTYVVCNDDHAIHPDLQRVLARRAKRTVAWKTDHSPFLSAPDLVAGLLSELAAEHGAP
jgi:pimeloyl-ACP methyl ester carboxylesterase